jgi:leucyl aminopeptidase (aminopeptidase T)
MNDAMRRGARIVVDDWMHIKKGERVLLLTDKQHEAELEEVQRQAVALGAAVTLHLLPNQQGQASEHIAAMAERLRECDVIVGAAHYSVATLRAVKEAVRARTRFLSLPLATGDGRSMLEYDFMTMNPWKSRIVSQALLEHINQSEDIRVETAAGTSLNFRKRGRRGDFTDGMAGESRTFASASFEVYIPVEETMTAGNAVVDGSLGYLGKLAAPFSIRIEDGRVTWIEPGGDGERLSAYLQSFNDSRLYHVSELGIGLNYCARCDGNCYIEDESAYGTFHLGFGRNVTLGGPFEANGHFDIIFKAPTLYADNRMLMEDGELIAALPSLA